MTALPSDEEIRARAEQLGLLLPGADLSPALRRSTAKLLLEEARAQASPLEPRQLDPILLSRITQPAIGGMIRVDVLYIPNPLQEGTT